MRTERLRGARKAKGWTQAQLAEASGFSRSSIINWENGKRAPRIADLEKLEDVLGVSSGDFSERKGTGSAVAIKPIKERPAPDHKVSPPGLAYWGDVVDRACEAAERGKDLPLIAAMLRRALEVVDAACIDEDKRSIASPEPAGERIA